MSFAAAMAAMFANPHMSIAARYIPVEGAERDLRLILQAPDEVQDFGGSRFATASVIADLRVSDAPELAESDRLVIDGVYYRVIGQPLRDAERLCWSAGLVRTAP